MAITRADLRHRLGEVAFCGDTIRSSAMTGSDSTKIVDTKLVAANSAYIYGQLLVTSGSASTNMRWVSDWTQSTGTFKITSNFDFAVSSADTYELHRQFSAEDKNDAINEAIRFAGRYWWKIVENESLTLVADTYDYSCASFTIPIDVSLGIVDVYWQDDITQDTWTRVSPMTWDLRNINGVLKLHLTELPSDTDKLRVIYKTRPLVLATDAATLAPDYEPFANYVCSKATAFLFQKRANLGEQGNTQHWQAMANQYHQQAEILLTQERCGYPNRRQTASEW